MPVCRLIAATGGCDSGYDRQKVHRLTAPHLQTDGPVEGPDCCRSIVPCANRRNTLQSLQWGPTLGPSSRPSLRVCCSFPRPPRFADFPFHSLTDSPVGDIAIP